MRNGELTEEARSEERKREDTLPMLCIDVQWQEELDLLAHYALHLTARFQHFETLARDVLTRRRVVRIAVVTRLGNAESEYFAFSVLYV